MSPTLRSKKIIIGLNVYVPPIGSQLLTDEFSFLSLQRSEQLDNRETE